MGGAAAAVVVVEVEEEDNCTHQVCLCMGVTRSNRARRL